METAKNSSFIFENTRGKTPPGRRVFGYRQSLGKGVWEGVKQTKKGQVIRTYGWEIRQWEATGHAK